MAKKKDTKLKKVKTTPVANPRIVVAPGVLPIPPVKKPVGRPSDYTIEIATRICEEIANTTDSYSTMCSRNEDFPDRGTMRRWRIEHEEFRTMYDQSKRDQAELFIEELMDIADDGRNDWMEKHYRNHSSWVINGEAIARSRLRADTRKWIASKLLPKVYGDRVVPPEDENPFSASERTELHSIIANLVKKHEREY